MVRRNGVCCVRLFEGGAVIFSDKKSFDADHVWQLVGKEKANVMLITGDAMARPLMDAMNTRAETGEAYDLSSMFVLASSAAIFSPSLERCIHGKTYRTY
jgi:acyl-CoA synthetase (AMP-forming)/AMP-acid ligase II